MKDTIEMAREAGLLTWLKPPEDVIERFKAFEALVRADERKIVINEPLTKEMWQRFEDEIRADEREALQAEVLEQCRINGMSAEREDALRAELTRLKASIALDKMAENARELGLDYEPAVQGGRDWSLLEATQESLREHMAEIKRLKAAQPVPVKTYHDGKPWPVAPVPNGPYSAPIKELWPVAPKPWVNLTDEEMEDLWAIHSGLPLYRAIEAKLKGKNYG
jgi:hypothetical protein